jgi:hypothetical protein
MSASGGYERIVSVIRAARSALHRSEMLAGTGRAFLVAGLAALTLVALDNLFRPGAAVRIVLLVLAAGITGYAVWREIVAKSRERMSDDAIAVRIEEAAGTKDNGIINALQLGRDSGKEKGLSGAIVRTVVERGAVAAGRFEPARVVDRRRVGRSVLLGVGAALFVILYAIVLPRHFGNAVQRYASPTAFVPPVSATILEVTPGDTAVHRGEELSVSMVASGELPSSARILVSTGDEETPSEMIFDGRAFSFTFEAVSEPFDYRVEAGDASSEKYLVTVVDPPEVKRIDLTYAYPEYLGLPDRETKGADGEIRAPKGTKVTVVAHLSEDVYEAAIDLGRNDPRSMASAGEGRVRTTFTVQQSGTWAIILQSRHAVRNRDPVRHRIVALPDELPRVAITAPGKDLTVSLPARVPVTVHATDDFGLTEITVFARRGDGGDYRAIATFPITKDRERTVATAIVLAKGDLLPGDVLTYHAVARDAYPFANREGRSRTWSLRVKSKADRAGEAEAMLADLSDRIRELIEKQEGVLRDTEALRDAVEDRAIDKKGLTPRADSLAESEGRIGAEMVALAGTVPTEVKALAEIRGTLLSLGMNEVVEAIRHLQDSRNGKTMTDVAADLLAAGTSERTIIAKLEELLGKIDAMKKKLAENPEEWIDEKMDEGDAKAAMEDALAKLKKFIREQEEVIRLTRTLEEKDVDDFSDEDLKLLEKLAASESELAKFLEDLKDDLSKIPDQDFANSTVLKELIEAYSEVELAAGALKMKNIELAVPTEQSGLEMAESLEENIEKWLEDVPDRIKWNMEEFEGEMPDVPMAELPDQLEDLIGELIEEEDDLMEEMEDTTSAWADSLDKGAGWGVSDGPISNMSAQGKTGNTLPNKNEIGGRSGEGRTGRSHGEMVEREATGKGGRRTPTRLTPDAIEGKAVKDSSKDPVGGATGGGKLAGGAGEGLRGPVPPQVKQDLGRLAGKQVGIRQKAEALDRALKNLNYPDEPIRRSVVLMREMEKALERGDLAGFSRRHARLVSQMEEGRTLLRDHARVVKDRSRAVPKEILKEVETVDLSALPEGYRKFLREYYRILSSGGSK